MRPMRRSLCVFSFLLLLLLATSVAQVDNTARPTPTTRVIGILSAMTLEIETLGQELTNKHSSRLLGRSNGTGHQAYLSAFPPRLDAMCTASTAMSTRKRKVMKGRL